MCFSTYDYSPEKKITLAGSRYIGLCKVLIRSDKSKTHLKGIELDSASLRGLHSGCPDTRVDARPRSPLSVGLLYVRFP